MIVVDASVMTPLLVELPGVTEVVARTVAKHFGHRIATPHLIDLEVCTALWLLYQDDRISGHMAESAIQDMQDFRINRYPHHVFLPRMWQLQEQLSAYDSTYLALAEVLGAPLITRDRTFLSVDTDAEVVLAV